MRQLVRSKAARKAERSTSRRRSGLRLGCGSDFRRGFGRSLFDVDPDHGLLRNSRSPGELGPFKIMYSPGDVYHEWREWTRRPVILLFSRFTGWIVAYAAGEKGANGVLRLIHPR